MRPLGELDAQGWIAKLRAKAAQDIDVVEAAARNENEERQQLLSRRWAVLKAAGEIDPDMAKLAVESVGRCPYIEGHAGSVAAARAVEQLVSHKLRTLLLLGPTGRGKSGAATWAMAETSGGAWLAATDCRVGLWDDARSKAVGSTILVVDDLGREGNDWATREWSDLLEVRHNRGKRTIVTSNLTLPAMVAKYGERLESRWADERYTKVVKVLGPDLRAKGGR